MGGAGTGALSPEEEAEEEREGEGIPGGSDTGDAEADPGPGPDDGLCQVVMACEPGLGPDVKTPCTLEVRAEDGRVDYQGGAVAWERGRSSRSVPKHQYGVELRDDADEDLAANLLGMGADSDWVLNGLWYDRLLLRNMLAFGLFNDFGPTRYAPEMALCELHVDGEYRGVYGLSERIKRDDDRVDISEHDAFVAVQIDHECFYTLSIAYGCLKLRSPDEDALTPEDDAAITGFLRDWEAAVLGSEPYDEARGVMQFVDLDSALDVVILEELMKNEDAFWTSMHLWRDAGGRVNWSPWDLDMTLGNLEYYDDYGDPGTWTDYRPPMIRVMIEAPGARERLAARWVELRASILAEAEIMARIDRYQALLGGAIERNFALWPIEQINYGSYFYAVRSYEEEDAHARQWIRDRLRFMDEAIGTY